MPEPVQAWIDGAVIVIGQAQTATLNANDAANLANEAAGLLDGVVSDSRLAEGLANAAALYANGRGDYANSKAGEANTAANNANNSVVKSAEFVDEDIVFTKEDDTKIILAGAKTTLSAYQTWLDLGNTGTAEDFIAFLKQEAVVAAGLANTAATNANTKAGLAGIRLQVMRMITLLTPCLLATRDNFKKKMKVLPLVWQMHERNTKGRQWCLCRFSRTY